MASRSTPDWSDIHVQIALFRGIIKYRPVGANKHFAMIALQRSLEESLGIALDAQDVWDALKQWYALDMLDEMVRCRGQTALCNVLTSLCVLKLLAPIIRTMPRPQRIPRLQNLLSQSSPPPSPP
jgi:hypothetical protein